VCFKKQYHVSGTPMSIPTERSLSLALYSTDVLRLDSLVARLTPSNPHHKTAAHHRCTYYPVACLLWFTTYGSNSGRLACQILMQRAACLEPITAATLSGVRRSMRLILRARIQFHFPVAELPHHQWALSEISRWRQSTQDGVTNQVCLTFSAKTMLWHFQITE
jgi:hypothetical protein